MCKMSLVSLTTNLGIFKGKWSSILQIEQILFTKSMVMTTMHQDIGSSNWGINHFCSSSCNWHVGHGIDSIGTVNGCRKTWRMHVALEMDVIVATREYIVSSGCLSCRMQLMILLMVPSQTIEMSVWIGSRGHYGRMMTKVGLVVVWRREIWRLEIGRRMTMSCTRPESWATQACYWTQTARWMGRNQVSSFLGRKHRWRWWRRRIVMMSNQWRILLEVKHPPRS